MYLYLFSI